MMVANQWILQRTVVKQEQQKGGSLWEHL